MRRKPIERSSVLCGVLCAAVLGTFVAGCRSKSPNAGAANSSSTNSAPFMSAVASVPPQLPDDAPAPDSTGGFDGKRAFAHVEKQVSFGPRPSGSQAIARLQDYIQSELSSYGCKVDVDSFSADTPAGRLPMKNIAAKIPGEKPGILLLGTHYDTKRLENFVGADDGGSSTSVMLELARLLCPQRGRYAVWITFFDGEEAVKDWSDTDSRYGSRQMAAKLSTSGELKKVRAFLLADIVGGRNLHLLRESSSTPALAELVWKTAEKLGYSRVFLNETTGAIQDDHDSFLKRAIPSVDVIDLDRVNDVPYWHTPQDNLDKISAKSVAIVGHVFLESVKQLQSK